MRSVPFALASALILLTSPAPARSFLRGSGHHGANVSLRKRLHVNDLIAEPGTVEVDWGNLYSYTSGNFTMPSTIKYTPAGDSLLWGRTEYSLAFDSLSSAIDTSALASGARNTLFSDRISLTATSVVYDSEHFDVAIAPQVTAFLRDDSGVRLGATTIARYDGHGNSIGATAGWTVGTHPSPTNPSGTWDFGAGYGRKLASAGLLGKITPHLNATLEKSTGFNRTLSAFGGVEYQMTERVAFDLSGQRFGLTGGGPDRQVFLGMTVNFGHPH